MLVSALNQGLLPVVNGNDTTDPRSELDNDQVAVAVAVASQASRLTFLTNVAGVYTDGQLRDRICPAYPAGGAGGQELDRERRPRRHEVQAERRGQGRLLRHRVLDQLGPRHHVVARSLGEHDPRATGGLGGQGTVVAAVGGPLAPAARWVGGIAYPMGSIGINREAERSLRAGQHAVLVRD